VYIVLSCWRRLVIHMLAELSVQSDYQAARPSRTLAD